MQSLLPDFLRAIVSTTGNVVLMLSLLQPRYGRRITSFSMMGVLSVDLGTAIFCYLSGNLTMLAKIDMVLFAVLCFVVKPLFKDTFMQWLFCYITIQNVSDIVIILSFIVSRKLPYPPYANVVFRLILFILFYWLLRFKVRPLYRQMVERWNIFFFVALAVWVTFTYYVFSSGDIVKTLTEQAIPLLLVIGITLAAYISVFICLFGLQKEYRLKQDKVLMELSGEAMKQRLSLMENAMGQMHVVQHDQRHIYATLLELLQTGEVGKAMTTIEEHTKVIPAKPSHFCDNVTVNAAVSYYAEMAARCGIHCDIQMDIPETLPYSELYLSMVLSNLIENGIHACETLNPEYDKYLIIRAIYTGQLVLEVQNPYSGKVIFTKEGYPVTKEAGHGRGSESVRAFVEKVGGDISYLAINGIFKVRLLL